MVPLLVLAFHNFCVVVLDVHLVLILLGWLRKKGSRCGSLRSTLAKDFASLLEPCMSVCWAFVFPRD